MLRSLKLGLPRGSWRDCVIQTLELTHQRMGGRADHHQFSLPLVEGCLRCVNSSSLLGCVAPLGQKASDISMHPEV